MPIAEMKKEGKVAHQVITMHPASLVGFRLAFFFSSYFCIQLCSNILNYTCNLFISPFYLENSYDTCLFILNAYIHVYY